jgi:hypothetical protein
VHAHTNDLQRGTEVGQYAVDVALYYNSHPSTGPLAVSIVVMGKIFVLL